MPQSTSNVVNNGTTQGLVNPANAAGQSFGQNLWNNTGNAIRKYIITLSGCLVK